MSKQFVALNVAAKRTLCFMVLWSMVHSLSVVMAVDRSKFRTCQQTSFCRRHRESRSKAAFDYALIPESIRFTRDPEGDTQESSTGPREEEERHNKQDDNDESIKKSSSPTDHPSQESLLHGDDETTQSHHVQGESNLMDPQGSSSSSSSSSSSNTNAGGGTGVRAGYYEKIKRLLTKGGLSSQQQQKQLQEQQRQAVLGQTDLLDPHYRGIEPFFTARLVNQSPLSYYRNTAAAATAAAGRGETLEELRLSLYLHSNGIARMRITEDYSPPASASASFQDGGKPYAIPRWTSDDLILNYKQYQAASMDDIHVLNDDETLSLLQKVRMEKMSQNDANGVGNYMAVRYGNLGSAADADADTSVLLMVQYYPFAIHMWRYSLDTGDVETDDPIVSFNQDHLMHFEIRKKQQEDGRQDVGSMHEQAESQQPSSTIEDKHSGKEIVGYWEDGLAIYADGTREERHTHTHASDIVTGSTGPNDATETVPNGDSGVIADFVVDREGMWEEKFGDHIDTKPYGPMSVGGDILFPHSKHLFGLPEHASSSQLQSTTGDGSHYKEPYRLYNLDVFEYELDETMSLYGEVPLVVSQSLKSGTVGAFWFNPTETFVDVKKIDAETDGVQTHWMSESGVLDLFLLPGPNPKAIYEQYAYLTGSIPIPPMFSLGYHQCRWNYRDEADVFQVHEKFEELDYPYDVLWLDIEHTDGKRYFTWDANQFPNPVAMQEKLSKDGRKMVTIVDPHIKRDDNYYIHKEATAKGLYIKDKNGEEDYDGWCWPGSSSYLDFTDQKVRSWWATQFAYDRYIGSTSSLYIWNDMNEPSVFNGPEVSMQKDLRNLNGVEHREWHNLYGILFQRATAEGLIERNIGQNARPFVLSRSFFAGSQRYGAIWTGDNKASWDHLKAATPMLLSLNIAALSFVGADVGGFFGNPDAELMTRWMQAGAYQPFFRGHAHHDAKRREPWMFGEDWMIKMRSAAMARYALLPYWYTVFRESNISGMPVMRSMWMEYPDIEELFHVDDQFLIGSDLLVKPVTEPGVTESAVLFPSNSYWYDIDSMSMIDTHSQRGQVVATAIVNSDIDKIPVFQRGGSIIPRKLRLRRSTEMMIHDPYTLYVALDELGKAQGTIYMDDENTFDYESKDYLADSVIEVDMKNHIRCEVKGSADWIAAQPTSSRRIERFVIMGVNEPPMGIYLDSQRIDFQYNKENLVLVIMNPNMSALYSWKLSFTYSRERNIMAS